MQVYFKKKQINKTPKEGFLKFLETGKLTLRELYEFSLVHSSSLTPWTTGIRFGFETGWALSVYRCSWKVKKLTWSKWKQPSFPWYKFCIVSTKTYITNISTNLWFCAPLINPQVGQIHKVIKTCLLSNNLKRNILPLILKNPKSMYSWGVYKKIILVEFPTVLQCSQ